MRWGRGGGKIPPPPPSCLKLVRLLLERLVPRSSWFCWYLHCFPKKQCFLTKIDLYWKQYLNLPNYSKLTIKWEKVNDMTIFWNDVIVKFIWRCFFLLSSLVTGPSFMSISSLVLELLQFLFIKDWPGIWKTEILLSEFCPISGDWDK